MKLWQRVLDWLAWQPLAQPTAFVAQVGCDSRWRVHELDGVGAVVNTSEPYVRKANAVKAAKRLSGQTPGSIWKVIG